MRRTSRVIESSSLLLLATRTGFFQKVISKKNLVSWSANLFRKLFQDSLLLLGRKSAVFILNLLMTNIHLFVLRLTQDHCHKWYEHFWDTKTTEAFHYKWKGKNVEYDRNTEHFSTEITGCLLKSSGTWWRKKSISSVFVD